MFTVFNMYQLATVAAGDVGHHEVLNGLFFRIFVVVGAPGEANTDTPVDLAVGAVDVVDDVIGDQDIAVIDRHIPLNRIALQVAEFAVGNTGPIDLVMKTLTQDSVVSGSR